MPAEQKLRQLGIDLPDPAKPLGAYVAAVRTGQLIFTARQLPLKDGQLTAAGFTDQAEVASAANDLLAEVVGHAGRHTRCASMPPAL